MNLLRMVTSIVCVVAILFSTTAFAGDVKPKGTVLKEDSYVFTIDEATRLLKRVEELEEKELVLKAKILELEKYKNLEGVRLKQLDLYKINLDYSQAQNQRYIGLIGTQTDLLDRYNKRNSMQTLENFGYLTLGIALTIGAFFAADAITDQMER